MSTQNILDKEDVLYEFDKKLLKMGQKYMLKKRFNLGKFEMKDFVVGQRLAEIICKNDCSRLPLRADAQEMLNILTIKL